jgi:predicted nucleic acid-binding protein
MKRRGEPALSMVVVADTSPINYLVLIDQVSILPRLYSRVLVPSAVYEELTHPAAPRPVRDWTLSHPAWLEVARPRDAKPIAHLDLGESQAIALAHEMGVRVLLIDDQAGRQEATRRGLKVAGTLSVLDEADQAEFLLFDDSVARLQKTSFRVSQAILADIMQKRSHRR